MTTPTNISPLRFSDVETATIQQAFDAGQEAVAAFGDITLNSGEVVSLPVVVWFDCSGTVTPEPNFYIDDVEGMHATLALARANPKQYQFSDAEHFTGNL